jgi:hypothetical protein
MLRLALEELMHFPQSLHDFTLKVYIICYIVVAPPSTGGAHAAACP